MVATEPTLAFIHVPRTGGASVRAVLSAAYRPDERAFLYDAGASGDDIPLRRITQLNEHDRASLRLVMGTFGYGLHVALPGGARYATIVRHPLDRAVSSYCCSLGDLAGPAAARPSLLEWLEQEPAGVDNGMVRLIAGRDGVPFGESPDDLLDEAIEHIDESFDAVLVRGRLSRSTPALEQLTGRTLAPIGRENVTPERPAVADLEPRARARLAELNQLDLRLFRAILERGDEPTPLARSVSVPTGPREQPAPAAVQQDDPHTDRTAHRPRGAGLSIGNQTLVFMHIAKTGGTSLRETLADAYGKDERAFVYDPADLRGAVSKEQLVELPEEQRQGLRLVMGHFQFGIHRAVGRPCRYLVVLRDPVDRVVSLYYHYLHLAGRRIGGRAREEQQRMRQTGMSLEDWVFGQNRLAIDNGMTRNLAARRRVRFGQCPDDLLDEALEHIDRHFAAVLVNEELARSHALLEKITGRSLHEVKRANVNKNRPALDAIDPQLLARIRKLNRLDARLYDIARERLEPLLTDGSDADQNLRSAP